MSSCEGGSGAVKEGSGAVKHNAVEGGELISDCKALSAAFFGKIMIDVLALFRYPGYEGMNIRSTRG